MAENFLGSTVSSRPSFKFVKYESVKNLPHFYVEITEVKTYIFYVLFSSLCSQNKCGGIQSPFVSLFIRDVLQQSAASSFLGHTACVTCGIDARGTLPLVASVYTRQSSLNTSQYDSGIE